jgi:hypothetical protein
VTWANETLLWEYQLPRLRGWWRRLEASTPEGVPDSFGLWNAETHWLERKIGKPSKDALRPKQAEFGLECMRRGISYYVCFGYRDEVLFFKDYTFLIAVTPPYWKA